MNRAFRHFRRLEEGIKVALPTDENGLTGRECPKPECLGNFNVKFGTGLKGENLPCHCPYCGHIAPHDKFWTPEQNEYVHSIATNEVSKALKALTQDWDRDLRQRTKNSFIKMSMEFKGGHHPIRYYQEKQLETNVVCDSCTLEYSIYGVFAFCPDCGVHNSLQILHKNFELVEKEIVLAQNANDTELAKHLIEDGLENAVSAFDGFGRASCFAFADKASNKEQAKDISFQNIVNAKNRVQTLYGFNLAEPLDDEQWAFVARCFQKRHLLAHTMGVIDEDYIKKANDPSAVLGRKITIDAEEARQLINLLDIVGRNLHKSLSA
ncbi:MAG: hypothetical protein HY808_15200 [Nitrospirae bacterium]|nr:hypothetical protein [Nitrospirota bacterium]